MFRPGWNLLLYKARDYKKPVLSGLCILSGAKTKTDMQGFQVYETPYNLNNTTQF